MIVPLGQWILRQACLDAIEWPVNIKVAVNLSWVQFRDRNLVETVKDALELTRLPVRQLELEITETVLLQESEATLAVLHRLRALGVRISMDDFGTGYSSMIYLRSFPFDKIKIDQSFIANLKSNPQSAAIVCAVVGLARGLNLPVLAEGVETSAQLDFLASESCDEVQGYLIGRPHPIAEYSKLIGRLDATDEKLLRA